MEKTNYLNISLRRLLTVVCALFFCLGMQQMAYAQPPNDLCANAEVFGLGGGMGTLAGTTVGANTDATPFCGTASTSPGVFYTFTAEDDGTATLDLCGAIFDSKISVYTGTCAALTCVIGEDDDFVNCGGNDPHVTFAVTNGTSYIVHVHGFAGGNGPFDMNFDLPESAAPPIDCQNPTPLNVIAQDVTICPGDSADLCLLVIGGEVMGGITESEPFGIESIGTDDFFTTDIANGNFQSIGIPTPGPTNFSYTGGVCVNDVYYAYDNNELNSFDITTGAATAIGTGTLAVGGFVQDMAQDPTTGTVYAISTNIGATALYTVDLTTGALTLIGIDNTLATCGIFFGIDNSGVAYMTDICDDATYQLDLTTGQNTLVGPLGVNLNFAQSGGFDPVTNTFYAYIFNAGTFSTQFGTIDVGSGAFNLITDLGFNQVASFAFCPTIIPGAGFTYDWTPVDGLSCTDCPKPRSGIDQTTVYTVVVTDACGQTATDDLTVTVAYDVQALACNNLINVSLDTLCQATITADMLLEDPVCGNMAYTVIIEELDGTPVPNPITSAYVGQRLKVTIEDPYGIISCWGYIVPEDKVDPLIACECMQGGTPVSMVTGSLDADDEQFIRPNNIGLNPGNCTPSGATVFYDRFDFSISAPDVYTFSMPSIVGPDFFFALYEGGFDPSQPCTNLLATDDDSNGTEPEITISLVLVPGNYTLVTTTFFAGQIGGAYNYTITSQGGGQVLARDAACEFLCFEDIIAPTPVAMDACGIVSLTSSDVVTDGGNCGITTILRTWIATDLGGNTAVCTQELRIHPGTVDDIAGPANFDGIDGRPTLLCQNICGGDLELADDRFCGPSDIYWNVLPAGHPYAGHPSPYDGKTWNCGDVKCFGTGEPGGANTCANIQSTFEDTRINICTTGSSDGCYKILRRWTSLDWCTGRGWFLQPGD